MGAMETTLKELAETLDPPMTARQVAALIWMHVIPAIGTRHTGKRGHPENTYRLAAVRRAHAIEAGRTAKQFTDSDWIASALIGLGLVRVDAEQGEIRWFNGDRAEKLGTGNYGWIHAGKCCVPAHRVIWIAADGEIPVPLQVNHLNRLRWDNRRANLELVTASNNMRHSRGTPYVSYHDAVAGLAELEPQPQTADPYRSGMNGGLVLSSKARRG